MNATIDTEERRDHLPGRRALGIAVDTEKGLLVPVIKDAGDLNIAGLAKKIADLAAPHPAEQGDARTSSAAARSRSPTTAPPAP